MFIKLINCNSKLLAQGIDLSKSENVALNNSLITMMPVIQWNYMFDTDSLLIEVQDGTTIPDLSSFGEVVPYDNSMG